jgi:hypothetical protein
MREKENGVAPVPLDRQIVAALFAAADMRYSLLNQVNIKISAFKHVIQHSQDLLEKAKYCSKFPIGEGISSTARQRNTVYTMFKRIYHSPRNAEKAWEEIAQKKGAEIAARSICLTPELLGDLQGEARFGIPSQERIAVETTLPAFKQAIMGLATAMVSADETACKTRSQQSTYLNASVHKEAKDARDILAACNLPLLEKALAATQEELLQQDQRHDNTLPFKASPSQDADDPEFGM